MSEKNAALAATESNRALAPVLGGIEITIKKRSGAEEKVKVRQLPVRLLNDWSMSIGDEATLVELYCDKIDKQREAELRKLGGEALALFQKLNSGQSGSDLEKISGELAMTRAKIDKLNSDARWDDELTPESHDEIVRLGYELNRPRFDRWLADRQNAIGHLKATYKQYLPEHPLVNPPPAPPPASPGSESLSPTSPQSSAEVTPK